MARGQLTFKQSDLKRAVRATEDAGIKVARVEIDKTGKIVLVAASASAEQRSDRNEWDDV